MEEQMTLQRIRRNNEKIIFRIGGSMLVDPACMVARPEAQHGWSAGNDEDSFYHGSTPVDVPGSTKVLAYI